MVQICPKCLCIYGFVNNFWFGRGDLRSPAGVHRTPLQLWRFESVHGFASVGNLYQKMHFAGSNLSTDPKTAPMASPRCKNASTKFRKTSESENSPNPIWRIGAGEISRNLRFSALRRAAGRFSCLHLNQTRIMWCVSDLDAKPCVADLDARGFCRVYTTPLAMMGVALNRCLPGRNAMLVTKSYVSNFPI